MGEENTGADHAKQCCNDLDHHDGPLRPAETKPHRRPNSQKNSRNRYRFAARLMISGNRECQKHGQPPARPALGWQHFGGANAASAKTPFIINSEQRNGRAEKSD
jgi:hypothetical protein